MRIRTVDSVNEMELVIDDYITRGYAVMRGRETTLVKKSSLFRTVHEVLLQLEEGTRVSGMQHKNAAHPLEYRRCESCRSQVSTEATFCRYCGAHLRSETWIKTS